MASAYAAHDETIQFMRRYNQLLLEVLRTGEILNHRVELIELATELEQMLTDFVPAPILTNLFYERSLNCLWELARYLHTYRRQFGERRAEIQPLYVLKHRLLERMIVLATSCAAFSWEVGRSTDQPDILSVRLTYVTLGNRRRAKRLHWPIVAVPVVAQDIIRQRYGNFPPPDVLARDD